MKHISLSDYRDIKTNNAILTWVRDGDTGSRHAPARFVACGHLSPSTLDRRAVQYKHDQNNGTTTSHDQYQGAPRFNPKK